MKRREVAIRRVEWVVTPPDAAAGEKDYHRYQAERLEAVRLIEQECGSERPHDLRVTETPGETIISYEAQRAELPVRPLGAAAVTGAREGSTAGLSALGDPAATGC